MRVPTALIDQAAPSCSCLSQRHCSWSYRSRGCLLFFASRKTTPVQLLHGYHETQAQLSPEESNDPDQRHKIKKKAATWNDASETVLINEYVWTQIGRSMTRRSQLWFNVSVVGQVRSRLCMMGSSRMPKRCYIPVARHRTYTACFFIVAQPLFGTLFPHPRERSTLSLQG